MPGPWDFKNQYRSSMVFDEGSQPNGRVTERNITAQAINLGMFKE